MVKTRSGQETCSSRISIEDQSSYVRPVFCELSRDVFLNIVAYLSIREVLSLRLTCKKLSVETNSRHVWRRFAEELMLQPDVSRPEEPFHSYTSQELQKWVIHRYKVQKALHSDPSRNLRFRVVVALCDAFGNWDLLPGGRWLLFREESGAICIQDCDTPHRMPEVLFPSGKWDKDWTFQTHFAFSADQDEARLTLKIAVIRTAGPKSEGLYNVRITKVKLLGHGDTAKLAAESGTLQEFTGKSLAKFEAGGFSCHGFFQIRSIHGKGRIYLQVFPPTADEPTTWILQGFDFNPTACDVYSLPNARLAVGNMSSIYIYPIPSPASTTKVEEIRPLHITPIKKTVIRATGRSSPHIGPHSTIVVYHVHGDIVVVDIPHSTTEPPTLKVIARYNVLDLFFNERVGLRSAVSLEAGRWGKEIQKFCVYDYSKAYDSEQHRDLSSELTLKKFKIPRVDSPPGRVAFDWGVGRIVMRDSEIGCISMWELIV